jgi:3-oxoacyl-(acyl-carrier-protein) synthase
VTAPHPEGHGAALAMTRALRDAGLSAADIDYVNAHGTGTPVGDRAESLAIAHVLGDVPVSSFKGAVGHTIAAAGAVEAALCLAAFDTGVLPGTVGLDDPDPECPANVLRDPVARRPSVVLSNSFGFGGQNCAVILGAP